MTQITPKEKYIIYDKETLSNFYSVGFLDYSTNKRRNFIICESQNDLRQMMAFVRSLYQNEYEMVGFNNLAFDAQILEWMINNYGDIKHWKGEKLAMRIAELATKTIELQNNPEKYLHLVPEWKMQIKQIDLFKQLHYDAKKIGLKWLQFTMRFPNIESMPIHHTAKVRKDQIPEILSYMDNDTDSTKELFKRVKFETELRRTLSNEYQINLMNASEPKMARDIFGHFMSERLGVPYRELKERRTYRNWLKGEDLVFDYVKFKDPILNGVLDFFNNLQFNPYEFDQNNLGLKKVIRNFKFHNILADVGLGGIHGCVPPGVYEEKEGEWEITDLDVASYYPNLGIKNGLYPEHLANDFCVVTDNLYQMRKKIDKKSPINYIFKIILNSAYGLSKEPNNYFHDPRYTFTITINGQLLLLKLAELLRDNVPGVVFYQFNTDGLTLGHHPKYKPLVQKVMKSWEKNTMLELESNNYKKMIIMDVNNYIAIDTKDKLKRKGLFGYSMKPEDREMAYHKNPSALVIPKALEAYFVHGVPYRDYIRGHQDIYDFCIGVKVRKDFNILRYFYDKEKVSIEKEQINQQVIRYYISNEQATLKKKYKDGSKVAENNKNRKPKGTKNSFNVKKESNVQELEAGWNTTVFNRYVKKPMEDYDIDYNYYIQAVRDIVDEIQPNVTNLKLNF